MSPSVHCPHETQVCLRQRRAEACRDPHVRGMTSLAGLRALTIAAPVIVSILAAAPALAQLRGDVLEKYAADRWDRIALSSEDPTLALRLCEQPHADPCAVVAEIWLTLPQGDRAPRSLDAELAKWDEQPSSQRVVEPARRTTIGGREAIEVATEGEHSIHIHKPVVHDTIVFLSGDRYAKCYGWSEPADHAAFSRALHDFCASYDLSTLRTE